MKDDAISRSSTLEHVQRLDHLATLPDGDFVVRLSEVEDAIINGLPAQPGVSDTNVGDTISRQAAIRWVKTECNPYGKPTLDFESGKKVIEHLEQMPSAQTEIVHCKDCKHWIPYDWMFSEIWESQNMDDYPQDEISCSYCDMHMRADDYCSRAERRTDG